ncbi:molybdenum cofactor biosynthesis protein B [Deinococcus deserti]|uniref:Molybdenum cofactor biosynthesis protein B n=1 Tax=Deinococcus deserti (strain DSM 17065 / CIP 109153 / LMG 22923 / VCD115) TaxID=546414 RepID=C1CW08_DEIDV|nr:molybdenum cofactor biosynthesis protein B [Deinococcus deserti]ACO46375.1 putative Molybdenum cofactor biosynthesis protein B [Deinococcus deserti VCD115]
MSDALHRPQSQGPVTSSAEHRDAAPTSVRVAVVTVSDTRTPETDTSGQYLRQELEAAGHQLVGYRLVRDDAVEIRSALVALAREASVVLLTGGTGMSGRDVTVPVVESMLTKPMPGFGELFRMLSYAQVGGAAMFSRAVGGLIRGAAVFAMPGSLNAVQTAWTGILRDELGHVAYEVERHGQPAGQMPGTLRPAPAEAISPASTPDVLSSTPPSNGSGSVVPGGLGRHALIDDTDERRRRR